MVPSLGERRQETRMKGFRLQEDFPRKEVVA